MKVIVTAAPFVGHLAPVLALGRSLAEAGHEVVAYASRAHRTLVERQGFDFAPYPAEADVDFSDMGRFSPPPNAPPHRFAQRRRGWEMLFVGRMAHEYRGLCDLLARFPADLVIGEGMGFATLPLLMRPREDRPAVAHVGATFLQWSREDFAPIFSGLPPAGTNEEYAAYRDLCDQAKEEWFDPIDALVNDMLADLGLPTLPLPFYDAMIALPDLFLQVGVPALEIPRRAPPPNLRFIGSTPPPAALRDLPDWADELDGTRRVVLVTQGTVANADLRLIRPTIEALADEPGVLVVATLTGQPADSLGPLPANVRVAPFLPFDWLMPRLDLLVTNGGWGAVTMALSHGVPLVQAGLSEDKREVAMRISRAGVGLALGTDTPGAPQIAAAVRHVLATPEFGQRAAAMAADFASHSLNGRVESLFTDLVQPALSPA